METPFTIGKLYYLPHHRAEQVNVPCPVCNGKKRVTLIDGYDVEWQVECDGCGLGFEGPKGYIKEYSYTPRVDEFVIKSVSSFHGDSWYVFSTTGLQCNWDQLVETYEEAWVKSEKWIRNQEEENIRRAATTNARMLKKATWDVRYHQEVLKEIRRRELYHLAKIKEIHYG